MKKLNAFKSNFKKILYLILNTTHFFIIKLYFLYKLSKPIMNFCNVLKMKYIFDTKFKFWEIYCGVCIQFENFDTIYDPHSTMIGISRNLGRCKKTFESNWLLKKSDVFIEPFKFVMSICIHDANTVMCIIHKSEAHG